MSRIPELMDDSESSMFLWWRQMAAAGLAFHPDDDALDVVNEGLPTFTKDEAYEVNQIVHGLDGMHASHGELIYAAAMQATEEPDITAARSRAIADWVSEDIQISPYAEVEKAAGGYWISARVWMPDQ